MIGHGANHIEKSSADRSTTRQIVTAYWTAVLLGPMSEIKTPKMPCGQFPANRLNEPEIAERYSLQAVTEAASEFIAV